MYKVMLNKFQITKEINFLNTIKKQRDMMFRWYNIE